MTVNKLGDFVRSILLCGYNMSCEISSKIENNILIVTISGVVDRDVIINTLKSYATLKGYQPSMNRIWDYRGATDVLVGKDDLHYIKTFMDNNKANMFNYRIAYVSDRDLVFGLTRMFGTIADSLPIKTRAFRDFDEALQWVSE